MNKKLKIQDFNAGENISCIVKKIFKNEQNQ